MEFLLSTLQTGKPFSIKMEMPIQEDAVQLMYGQEMTEQNSGDSETMYLTDQEIHFHAEDRL